MTTLIRLAKRANGMAPQQLHAAVASARWRPAEVPGLIDAARSLTLLGGYRRGEPIYDVIDELRFESESMARAALSDATFDRQWHAEYLEVSTIAALIVDEHVAKPGDASTSTVKNFEFVTRRPDLDRESFRRYWMDVHGPLAAQIKPIRRYVQSHVVPSSYSSGEPPRFDGLALTWFDDVAAMRESGQTPAYEATRADEANFIAGELPFIIATEQTAI